MDVLNLDVKPKDVDASKKGGSAILTFACRAGQGM